MKAWIIFVMGMLFLTGCYGAQTARQPVAEPQPVAPVAAAPKAPVKKIAAVKPAVQPEPAQTPQPEKWAAELTSVQDPRATEKAYVFLSEDGTVARVQVPGSQAAELTRSFTANGPRWTAQGVAVVLERLPGGWRLFENDMLIYWGSNPQE